MIYKISFFLETLKKKTVKVVQIRSITGVTKSKKNYFLINFHNYA